MLKFEESDIYQLTTMLDQFNKILLSQGVEESFLKITTPFHSNKSMEFGLDKNSFNYIFEEFISRGAVNMVLLPNSGYKQKSQIL